jgi:hypothetical protein
MPVEQETTLNISCDNSACPGNDLTTDRMGFRSSRPRSTAGGTQFVYCCADCAGTVGRRSRPRRPGRADARVSEQGGSP